jgi:hypothetical protein
MCNNGNEVSIGRHILKFDGLFDQIHLAQNFESGIRTKNQYDK